MIRYEDSMPRRRGSAPSRYGRTWERAAEKANRNRRLPRCHPLVGDRLDNGVAKCDSHVRTRSVSPERQGRRSDPSVEGGVANAVSAAMLAALAALSALHAERALRDPKLAPKVGLGRADRDRSVLELR